MCYEATIASAGGDKGILAKSLIISLENATANWYSRLPPRCIYFWQQLKEKFLLNLQGFQAGSTLKKIFYLVRKERKKYCLTFTEGSCSSKLKPQKCPTIKTSRRSSNP
jgi:hypothetical protein